VQTEQSEQQLELAPPMIIIEVPREPQGHPDELGDDEFLAELQEAHLTVAEKKAIAEQLIKSQIFASVFSLPIAVACALVLLENWSDTCSGYLRTWLLGVIALQFFRLPLRLCFIRNLLAFMGALNREEEPSITLSELKASCVYLILCILNITAITWYFIGVVEVFRPTDCSDESPTMYKLSLALVVIFLAFLAYSFACRCLFICILCYHRNNPILFREHPEFIMHAEDVPDPSATPEAILSLTGFKYPAEGDSQSFDTERDSTCSICLSDFEPGDEVTRLPCKHVFHLEEVQQWLNHRGTCPLCNAEVTVEAIEAFHATSLEIEDLKDQTTPVDAVDVDVAETTSGFLTPELSPQENESVSIEVANDQGRNNA